LNQRDYLYASKSTLVEWLLQENIKKNIQSYHQIHQVSHLKLWFQTLLDLNRLLENERIGKKLLLMLLDTLIKGFVKKNIPELELKAISDALKLLENPLVMVEMECRVSWPWPSLGGCKQQFRAGPPKFWGPIFFFFYKYNAYENCIYISNA